MFVFLRGVTPIKNGRNSRSRFSQWCSRVCDSQNSIYVLIKVDLLKHPDDLTNKLPMLIKKIAMERASVEAQLKTVMESQLDATQKGIDALAESRKLTEKIKSALIDMDKICGDSENNIKNYPFIQKVSSQLLILDISRAFQFLHN